jgi:integrase
LTDDYVAKLKGRERAYRESDGYNLYIQVMASGRKCWKYVYYYKRRQYVMDLGDWPRVKCDDARELVNNCDSLIERGINPKQLQNKMKEADVKHHNRTIKRGLEEWYCVKKHQWTPEYMLKTQRRMERHVLPVIGDVALADVTRNDILQTIRKVEETGALAESRAVYQVLAQFFQYAIAANLVFTDPTYAMKPALASRKKKHHKAMRFDDVPQFLDLVKSNVSMDLTIRYAASLMVHTFVRISELVGATWDEVDFDRKVWVIPAERMKMGKSHVVPLSSESLRILKNLHRRNGNRRYVFATPQGSANTPISVMSVRRALYDAGYKGQATVHGFRSLAMTVLQEELAYPFEVVDAQLAHTKKHSLGEAYDRAKFLERRKIMMEDWSKLIERKCDEYQTKAS